jgi:hypothetical protein
MRIRSRSDYSKVRLLLVYVSEGALPFALFAKGG